MKRLYLFFAILTGSSCFAQDTLPLLARIYDPCPFTLFIPAQDLSFV